MPNRLAQETSPYLLQHQDNPVDWYPWGEEAFARARAENKPIFLSIGYSACHWCHVMAHESFEDAETAAFLNDHFVSIKVDREERPDVDSIYMSAVQAITGSGGWPMSVFLMPDGRPFYGGTYFPNNPRHGMPAFSQIINRVSQLYAENHEGLTKDADGLTQAIQHSLSLIEMPDDIPVDDVFGAAFQVIASSFDAKNGGFSTQPKFPPSMTLELLLRLYQRYDWKQALMMVRQTLDRMAAGGMYDQLGGGFHRYSTDSRWLVPHFEKMLYDNALLIRAYLNGFLVSGDTHYRDIVEQTAAYIQREMTSPQGAFYSSQDADSAGHEGEFFVWTEDELREALKDQPHLEAVLDYWGVAKGPNFEGRNILWVPDGIEAVAVRHHVAISDVKAGVQAAAKILFERREKRVRPGTDTKILTAWNGLMIDSLAAAGRALGEPQYVEMAQTAARFILTEMRKDGRLLRSYREGQAKHMAYLEDYAALIVALVSLYQSTFDMAWFEEAIGLCEQMVDLFWDEAGGFYDTARDHETLITRPQELTDNAVPSGASLAVEALLRLAILADRPDWREKALKMLGRLAPAIQGYPAAFSHLACQLDFLSSNPHEIVLAGTPGADDLKALQAVINSHYLPNSVLALAKPDASQPKLIPLLEDKQMIGGAATAFVCHDFVCKLPVTSPADLAAELGLTVD